MIDYLTLLLIRQQLEDGIEHVEEQLPEEMYRLIQPSQIGIALGKATGIEPIPQKYYPAMHKLRNLLLTLDEALERAKQGGCNEAKEALLQCAGNCQHHTTL